MTSMQVMVLLQNVRRELMSSAFLEVMEFEDAYKAGDITFKVLSKYIDKMINHID